MRLLLLALVLFFALPSCKKSSTEDTLNYEEILRDGKWKMKAFTYKVVSPLITSDSVVDVLKDRDSCYLDDYITFNANYKGTQYTGGRKCNGELDELPFDWYLKDNKKTLVINNGQYTFGNWSKTAGPNKGTEYIEAKITKMSEKTMTLTYEVNNWQNINLFPAKDSSYFVDYSLIFTQIFEK